MDAAIVEMVLADAVCECCINEGEEVREAFEIYLKNPENSGLEDSLSDIVEPYFESLISGIYAPLFEEAYPANHVAGRQSFFQNRGAAPVQQTPQQKQTAQDEQMGARDDDSALRADMKKREQQEREKAWEYKGPGLFSKLATNLKTKSPIVRGVSAGLHKATNLVAGSKIGSAVGRAVSAGVAKVGGALGTAKNQKVGYRGDQIRVAGEKAGQFFDRQAKVRERALRLNNREKSRQREATQNEYAKKREAFNSANTTPYYKRAKAAT